MFFFFLPFSLLSCHTSETYRFSSTNFVFLPQINSQPQTTFESTDEHTNHCVFDVLLRSKLAQMREKEFNLKIVTDLDTVHDYLSGILWTIFFHRLFGSVKPVDGRSFSGIPYPCTHYPELEELIVSKINGIVEGLTTPRREDNGTEDGNSEELLLYKCVLVVKFYEKSMVVSVPQAPLSKIWSGSGTRSATGSLSNSRVQSESSSSVSVAPSVLKYQNCWEKWVLSINILNNRSMKLMELDNTEKLDFYKADFENNMFAILDMIDGNKSHIPPIQSIDLCPFPYKILYALSTHDVNALKKTFSSFETSDSSDKPDANPNDEGSLDYSMESLITTEAGDVMMGHSNSGNSSQRAPAYSGQEMLKTGYKFIKKLLE